MAGNLVQGAVFTLMVVRAGMLRDPAFEPELAEQVRRSPRFFLNAPVVLDLKEAAEFTRESEFAEAREILRRHTLTLIGMQNAHAGATPDGGAAPASQASRQTRPQPSRPPAARACAEHGDVRRPPAKTRLMTQPVGRGPRSMRAAPI